MKAQISCPYFIFENKWGHVLICHTNFPTVISIAGQRILRGQYKLTKTTFSYGIARLYLLRSMLLAEAAPLKSSHKRWITVSVNRWQQLVAA